jgi:hypothetical protein
MKLLSILILPLLAFGSDAEADQIALSEMQKQTTEIRPTVITKNNTPITTYTTTTNVNFSSVSLAGLYVETINAPRILEGGTYIGTRSYHLELPNMATTSIKTTTTIKSGVKIGLDTDG